MKTKDFYFDLPEDLIAQHPAKMRGNDKLMKLDRFSGKVEHFLMENLCDLIEPNTLMIFNNSKVRRSRCYAKPLGKIENENKAESGNANGNRAENLQKATKEVEFLLLNSLDTENLSKVLPNCQKGKIWKAMVKNAKRQKVGKRFQFLDGTIATIIENDADIGTEFRTVEFDKIIDEKWFEKNGHIPLPPYIKREDIDNDAERYQTIYAKETGSAAAPTAGLHFTNSIFEKLKAKNVQIEYVTLHVGLGTFLPVRAEQIENHKMHEEFFTISEQTALAVEKAKAENRPVLAVGTTSLRTLESAWNTEKGILERGTHSTSIFIYPGYKFKVVDKLFTNFHTPESTLLMLVSAFAGKENILNAYKNAVENKYKFFSYGDAMLID